MNLRDKFKELANKSNSNSFDTNLKTILDKIESRAKSGKYSLFWNGHLDPDIYDYFIKEGFTVLNFIDTNSEETGVLIKWS